MAKKKAAPKQKPLDTMEDEFEVPADLQAAADEYAAALTSKNRATSKFNAKKDHVIEKMAEHGIERVRINTDKGEKFLVHRTDDKLKLEKVKADKDSD